MSLRFRIIRIFFVTVGPLIGLILVLGGLFSSSQSIADLGDVSAIAKNTFYTEITSPLAHEHAVRIGPDAAMIVVPLAATEDSNGNYQGFMVGAPGSYYSNLHLSGSEAVTIKGEISQSGHEHEYIEQYISHAYPLAADYWVIRKGSKSGGIIFGIVLLVVAGLLALTFGKKAKDQPVDPPHIA